MADLVTRIGGPERLHEILTRFYERLAADVIVGFFFVGHDLGAIIDGQHAFLCWAFGAADELHARHPRDAHRSLVPILRGHFDRRMTILRECLEAEGLAAADIEAWLKVERSMRAVVQAR